MLLQLLPQLLLLISLMGGLLLLVWLLLRLLLLRLMDLSMESVVVCHLSGMKQSLYTSKTTKAVSMLCTSRDSRIRIRIS